MSCRNAGNAQKAPLYPGSYGGLVSIVHFGFLRRLMAVRGATLLKENIACGVVKIGK